MKTPIISKPLKPGDTIGIVAPAASFEIDKFQKGVSVIKDLGFNVEVPDGIFQQKRYLAGDDEHRAKVFDSIASCSDIDAIICARGGFGTLRVLPHLTERLLTYSPKRFIGFSDITPLINILAFKHGWTTFHGPVVTMMAEADTQTIDSFYKALTIPFQDTMPQYDPVRILSKGKTQIVSGRLWGGNLTTLCHMIGTPYAVNSPASILFLEDRGEAPYRIDRLLFHLKMSASFESVKGVLLGSFQDCGDIEIIHELILECFGDEIPIFTGYKCGHTLPNYTFPIGFRAEMNTSDISVRFLRV
ncbi:Peptidase S66, LD-carboxypeptidase A [Candidatus Magnetomorum sp. HK-1]|nr:Peptidase S66, LD-carboxypeptidase A [Candidatus Magnetomorum sp. HK-1]